MKNKLFMVCLMAAIPIGLHATDRNVLVEVFTNSHCPLCPSAHSTLNAFNSTDTNATHVRYIFYHMTFPYSDDPLNQANTEDPAARNQYYGPYFSTPVAFFDGKVQSNSYGSWAGTLDSRVGVQSPLSLDLSGSKQGTTLTITATVTKTDSISVSDLVIHFVAVENVDYQGRNGVTPQPYVMRKMFGSPGGDPLTVDVSAPAIVTKSETLSNITNLSNAGVVVFIQSTSTKDVYQSEYIPYGALTVTEVAAAADETPSSFSLAQNYPNPFNPSTTISYSVPRESFVTLTVYNMIGQELRTLVSSMQSAGDHTVRFDASGLSGGIYFYKLRSGHQTAIKKMILLK